jgi:hypothetical protein
MFTRWTAFLLFASAATAFAKEPSAEATAPEFSGPQQGEKLVGFRMRHLTGDEEGGEIDPVEDAAGKPLVLVFVHEINRPSIGLSRVLLTYAAQHRSDGVRAAMVFLPADATATEDFVKRAAHALPEGVPIGASIDGAEGPGAHGLNRKVTLTILVAKENRVTANFALVQPSLQADGPKIAAAIASAGGFEPPTAAELAKIAEPARRGRP